MAILSPVSKSTSTISAISNSVSRIGTDLGKTRKSIANINKVFLKRTKIRSDIFNRTKAINQKRIEASKRKDAEDAIEAGKVTGSFSPATRIAAAGKGFLQRIIDFVGTLAIGWLVNNLPTWIAMGKEFIARVNKAGQILSAMYTDTINIITGFGRALGAVLTNIVTLDFLDSSKRVENSFAELNKSFDDIGSQFDEAFKLFETPLTQGTYSGENAPDLGTQNLPETMTPGAARGSLGGIHKQALDIISRPESGGNYNAMNRGQGGDSPGGSKQWLGKNLTDMTIGEVLQLQKQGKVWATGRYQFVPNTLPGVVKSANLKPSDPFSRENQDRMAMALMQQRGLQPWTVGGSKYSAKERAIVEQARKTPLSAETSTPAAVSTKSGGGQIVQYLHGDRSRSGYRADHWNHDHFSFTTRDAAVRAFKALQAAGYSPYEFEGFTRVGGHSDTGGHYGPVGGRPTKRDTSDGTAFDIPYSSYGSGPVGKADYAKSLKAYQIVSAAIGAGGGGITPSSTQAQVAPTQKSPQQGITPTKRGQDVIVSVPQPQPQPSGGGGGRASSPPPMSQGPSSGEVLNRFMKNKLLLDLAYV